MQPPPEFPLPQPSGVTCPNCGAAQAAGTARCSHCGAPIAAPTPSGLSPGMKTVASIVLALAALGLGAFGSCLGLIGVVTSGEAGGFDGMAWLLVVGPILAAAACVWAIFKLNKRPR